MRTFATVATGGFSTHAESVAYFMSWKIELVIRFFMFAAGVNFAFYDLFVGLVGAALGELSHSPWSSAFTWGSSSVRSSSRDCPLDPGAAARRLGAPGLPPVPPGAQGLLLSGHRVDWHGLRDRRLRPVAAVLPDTADGSLCHRGLRGVNLRAQGGAFGDRGAGCHTRRAAFVGPRAIHDVKVDGTVLEEGVLGAVTGYFILWILVFSGGITMSGYGISSSATAVLATLNNIGPGLGKVGPTVNLTLP